jgi:hypothetical protein
MNKITKKHNNYLKINLNLISRKNLVFIASISNPTEFLTTNIFKTEIPIRISEETNKI